MLQARKTTRKENQNSHSIRQKKVYQKSEPFSSGRRKTPEKGAILLGQKKAAGKVRLPAQSSRLLANRKKSHSVESEKNLVLRVLFVTRIVNSEIFMEKKVPSYKRELFYIYGKESRASLLQTF